jgi:hypothetical protein
MGSHQQVQLADPSQPIGDPPSREHAAVLVEQAQVMVGLAPVHPNKQHGILLRSDLLSVSQRRTCGALMAVLTGTTSHQPSALLNTGQGTLSPESSRLPFLQVLTDRQLRHSLTHSRLVQAH